jgi:hypothetical protein
MKVQIDFKGKTLRLIMITKKNGIREQFFSSIHELKNALLEQRANRKNQDGPYKG